MISSLAIILYIMIKSTFILISLLLLSISCTCQKYDYNWQLCRNVGGQPYDGSFLDFNFNPPVLTANDLPIPFDNSNLTMSNMNGELIFYSNGLSVADATHQIMGNGYGITTGLGVDTTIGYFFWQNLFAIPKPGSDSIYYVFHYKVDSSYLYGVAVKFINFSIIDMSKNNGNGMVIQKHVTCLFRNYLDFPTSVRHANGRDWWILTPDNIISRYYSQLLTTDSIYGPWEQDIGSKPSYDVSPDSQGSNLFSPDGATYIDYDSRNGIRIYNFDRCTGLLSNWIVCSNDSILGLNPGAAISKNNRYLYVTNGFNVYQYDLWADDICASKDTIAHYDGGQLPLYSFAQLGPDGKIYIESAGNFGVVHIIHSPDLKGDLCQFEESAIDLPCYAMEDIPHFPNYRLYDLPGSPCDTLGINDPNVATEEVEADAQEVTLYPNPATNMLYLSLPGYTKSEVRYSITDPAGRKVAVGVSPVFREQASVVVEDLAEGMYFMSVTLDDRRMVCRKLVIHRH
jgi:hypothetical protein